MRLKFTCVQVYELNVSEITFEYSSLISVTMATCLQPYSRTTAVMVSMLALSEEMVLRKLGNLPLSEREIDVAV